MDEALRRGKPAKAVGVGHIMLTFDQAPALDLEKFLLGTPAGTALSAYRDCYNDLYMICIGILIILKFKRFPGKNVIF